LGIEEGVEKQTKGIDNLFDRKIAEKFPNLKRVIQVQEVYRTSNHQNPKRNTPRHIIIKTLTTENKENTESYKREKTSHI
jgi:hypothetical protein